ncbi:MAG: acetamidase/formamidase family protein [Proteobacteria bacterium]|nr:acetamidase/formamidase family protein [Pseudomonadota bacterium]MBI3495966.1 acetamidase/formamidase family protein [Pseudomonadota bacterium]
MARHHEIPASPETVHWGVFSASLPPVLSVESGDRVTLHCVSGGPETLPPPPMEVLPEHRQIHAKVKMGPGGHILTGPVRVNGAMPGDTLEIRILDVALRQDWGWNAFGPTKGTIPEDFPYRRLMHIPLDRKTMHAQMPWGMRIPLKPFCGVMGVAPPANFGAIDTIVPRQHGGNLDNKELGAGATLFLPVWTEGALFSAGDGHAVQGDGEVCVTALETAVSGTFELILRKDLRLLFPRAETPTHYITMGLDPDLDDAAKQALREMIKFICERVNVSAEDAYTLCSLAVDFRVTQLVDGNKGVHGMLAKSLLA